jgi:uncharacterized Zn finger protein
MHKGREHIRATGLLTALMKIELSCRECGSNNFSLNEASDDHSVIKCRECGHVVGTLAELKQQVVRQLHGI